MIRSIMETASCEGGGGRREKVTDDKKEERGQGEKEK